VIVPFLLGLKFKTAVLVPLALALIALKTWKALTLGLLSLVLTGALVIFKLSKPKVDGAGGWGSAMQSVCFRSTTKLYTFPTTWIIIWTTTWITTWTIHLLRDGNTPAMVDS
jgi:hypothetical protein